MSKILDNLLYTSDHEWLSLNDDGSVTVGISDHAQAALGELVFVEVPNIGDSFSAGDSCAVVESVKAASDMYCPVSGTVIAVNAALADQPELVNSSPYDAGWVFRLQPEQPGALDELLDADAYRELLANLED